MSTDPYRTPGDTHPPHATRPSVYPMTNEEAHLWRETAIALSRSDVCVKVANALDWADRIVLAYRERRA